MPENASSRLGTRIFLLRSYGPNERQIEPQNPDELQIRSRCLDELHIGSQSLNEFQIESQDSNQCEISGCVSTPLTHSSYSTLIVGFGELTTEVDSNVD